MDGFLAFLMRTHTDGYRNEILPNGLVDLFSQRRPKYLSNDVSFFFFAAENPDGVAFSWTRRGQAVLTVLLLRFFSFLLEKHFCVTPIYETYRVGSKAGRQFNVLFFFRNRQPRTDVFFFDQDEQQSVISA